ncbi:hypothetical protein [Mammaliicoccus stepanovicii]|uniref:Uncharacterized protein n=1 Tax=Mammaliicoccus stepanovicii TaxID=643214 RepID=A0A239YT09_9STAP|nr:hypothetical protein [Mammaliicoccus stepanovicii]PNZ73218.1 hypothetical protein CD111_09995 [Mammaliicoccus stepanovicii]GGI42391.1 hypothetical protein GCM10010896_18190 [Mammaliicoccus stepanovicii]SNV61516.1 Uncharacterised protein [Mammaliicoccus stepanovicii]
MYYESNILVSPRLDQVTKNQLSHLSEALPSYRELEALIEMLEHDQPYLNSIAIGTSDDKSMINIAQALKTQLESRWYEINGYDIYIHIVVWKDRVGSSKKYVKQFMSQNPDAWIILGSKLGFSSMIKRLYREEVWMADKTYCSSASLSQLMINMVGNKYFEGINNVNIHGEYRKVVNGKLIKIK